MNVPITNLRTGKAHLHYLIGALVAVFSAVLYLEALSFGFINWDDYYLVLLNPLLRLEGLSALRAYFSAVVEGNWFPLTLLSYKLDYMIWGLNPFGYHLSNIIFHSLNTFLVYVFTVRLFMLIKFGAYREHYDAGCVLAGIVASALFGVHPLHVESVAWVAERKDVVCAFFSILSALFYFEHKTASAGEKKYLILSIAAFCLALLGKPMAVTLPVLFVLLDYYPLSTISNLKELVKNVGAKVYFFAISLASSYITVVAQKKALAGVVDVPISVRLINSVENYAFYLYQILFPWKLLPLYSYPEVTSFASLEFAVSFALIIGLFIVAAKSIKTRPYAACVIAAYFIMLLPVIGVVQFGRHTVADRFMYLPSIPIFVLCAAGVLYALEKSAGRSKKILPAILMVAVFLLLAGKTTIQTEIWRNSVTLWKYQVENSKEYNGFVYLQMVKAYVEAGRYGNALEYVETMIMKEPENPGAYNYRAVVFMQTGREKKAKEDFLRSLALNGQSPETYWLISRLVRGGASSADSAFLDGLRIKAERNERIGAEEIKMAIDCVKRL